jgi:thiamine biosynthesis lipoprotein
VEERRLVTGDWKVVHVRTAMSTRVSIAAIDGSLHLLEEALGRTFAEMDRLIDLLNRFDHRSAVSVLNREGRLAGPPPELAFVLDRACMVHHLSGGAFDVTVQPLVDLLHGSPEVAGGAGPDPAAWREALSLVGPEALVRTARSVRFERQGMGVTLDGIAKGFIVDAMAEGLNAHGVDRFLIDAGGDIRASGLREDDVGWTVAVRDPRDGGILPDALQVTAGGIATSGGYEARFDPEGAWHHIVSGRTGRSPDDVLSVTVTGPSAHAADALATAVFLMSPREGVGFVDTLPGYESLSIDATGRSLCSAGWRDVRVANPEKGVT